MTGTRVPKYHSQPTTSSTPAAYEGITAQDVQRVSATYLDPRAYALTIARPEVKS